MKKPGWTAEYFLWASVLQAQSAQGYFVGLAGWRAQRSMIDLAMERIYITDIEAAINHWRQRAPSGPGLALAPEVCALAEVYAQMVFGRVSEVDASVLDGEAMFAWLAWYETTSDTPCIAICSTSQGDGFCKGCGRSFEEVQHWLSYSPVQKRAVWQRITADGTAWRFNRYAERALGTMQTSGLE